MNRGPDVELVGVRAEWVTTEGVVRLHVNVEGVDFVPVRNGSRGDPDVAASSLPLKKSGGVPL